jgi:hypothetical protein
MVVGHEDGPQTQPLALESLDHRLRVTRVDHGHIATITQPVDEPDIVVAERLHRRCFELGLWASAGRIPWSEDLARI